MTDFVTLVMGVDATGMAKGVVALKEVAEAATATEAQVTASTARMGLAEDILAGIVRASTATETIARIAMASEAQAAADQIAAASARRAAAEQAAASAIIRVQRQEAAELAALAASYSTLRANLDPLYATSMRYAQAVETANAAVEAGIVTQEQANRVIGMAGTAYLQATPAAEKVATAAAHVASSVRLSSIQMMEAMHVTREMGTMFLMGVDPMRAFTMEAGRIVTFFEMGTGGIGATFAAMGNGIRTIASAIFSFLGVTGVVVLGIAALGAAVYAFSPKAQTLGAAIEAATTANDAFGKSFNALKTDMSEATTLQSEYIAAMMAGNAQLMQAVAVQFKAQQAKLQLDKIDALDAMKAANDAAAAETVAYNTAKAQQLALAQQLAVDQAGIINTPAGMDPATFAAAAEVTQKLLDAATADLAKQSALLDRNNAAYDYTKAGLDVINVKLGVGVGLLDGIMKGAPGATWLTTAIDQVEKLANAFLGARIAAYDAATVDLGNKKLADMNAGLMGRAGGVTSGGYQQGSANNFSLDAWKNQAARLLKVAAAAKGTTTAVSGLAASYDPLIAAANQYAKAQDDINAAVAAGAISQAQANQYLADARAKFDAATQAAQNGIGVWATFKTSLASGIDSMIAQGGSLAKMFQDVVKQIELAIVKSVLLKAVAGGSATDSIGQLLVRGLTGGFGATAATAAAGATGAGAAGAGAGIMGAFGSSFMGGVGSVAGGIASGGLAGGASAVGTALTGATAGLDGFATALGAVALPLAAAVFIIAALHKTTTTLASGMNIAIANGNALAQTFETIRTSTFFGLFSHTNTYISSASQQQSDEVTRAYQVVQQSVQGAAAQLGIGADAFNSFAYNVSLDLNGLSQADAAAKVQQMFGDVGNAMASLALAGASIPLTASGAADYLQTLADDLTAVNASAKLLGFQASTLSVASGVAAGSIVALYGSLQNFQSANALYFQNFYTQQEQTIALTAQMQDELLKLGITTVPKTIAEFRALVDAANAAGNTVLANQLIALGGEFVNLQNVANNAASAVNAAAGALFGFTDQNAYASLFEYEKAQALGPAGYSTAPGIPDPNIGSSPGTAALATTMRGMLVELFDLRRQTAIHSKMFGKWDTSGLLTRAS